MNHQTVFLSPPPARARDLDDFLVAARKVEQRGSRSMRRDRVVASCPHGCEKLALPRCRCTANAIDAEVARRHASVDETSLNLSGCHLELVKSIKRNDSVMLLPK